MKNKTFIILLIIACLGLATTSYAARSLIGKEDLHMWDGLSGDTSYTRTSSGGYTLTMHDITWVGVDVLHEYGASVNQNSTTLQAALTAVGTSHNVAFWMAPGTWDITSGVTIPENVILVLPMGSVLAIDSGITLTINGPVKIGDYQVFSGNGQVAGLSYVNGLWFGMVGDDSTDCNTAFVNAIYATKVNTDGDETFAPYYGGKLYIPAGIYQISGVTITKPIEIVGAGRRHTVLKANSGSTGFLIKIDATDSSYQNNAGRVYGVNLRDFAMNGHNRGVDVCAVEYDVVDRSTAQNLDIRWFKNGAIKFTELRESDFSSIYIRYCGDKENDKPAIDFRDGAGVADGSNNINFTDVYIIYPYGDGVIYRAAAGCTGLRQINWTNCMFHGYAAALGGTQTNAMKGGCGHYIHGVENIRFVSCHFTAAGHGQSHIFLEEDTDLNETPSGIEVISSKFSPPRTVAADTVTSISIADDTVTVMGHELYTGAKVSFSSTANLPQDGSGDLDGQYFIIYTDTNTVQIATTKENAYAETEIDITNAGTGTITLTSRAYSIDVESGDISLSSCSFAALGTNNASIYNNAGTVRGLNSCEFTGAGGNIIAGNVLTDAMDIASSYSSAPVYKALAIAGVRDSSTGVTEFTLPTNLDTSVIYTINAGGFGCSGTTTDAGPLESLGVNVIFPAPSAVNDNKVFGLQKVGSGTSALVCTTNDTLPIGTSGATYYTAMDTIGDIMWFRTAFESAVSYYFVQGHIQ